MLFFQSCLEEDHLFALRVRDSLSRLSHGLLGDNSFSTCPSGDKVSRASAENGLGDTLVAAGGMISEMLWSLPLCGGLRWLLSSGDAFTKKTQIILCLPRTFGKVNPGSLGRARLGPFRVHSS